MANLARQCVHVHLFFWLSASKHAANMLQQELAYQHYGVLVHFGPSGIYPYCSLQFCPLKKHVRSRHWGPTGLFIKRLSALVTTWETTDHHEPESWSSLSLWTSPLLTNLPSLKLTASLHPKMDGWKMIVSFWDGSLAGAMLVSGSVFH